MQVLEKKILTFNFVLGYSQLTMIQPYTHMCIYSPPNSPPLLSDT